MIKAGIDQDAITDIFAKASAKQADALRVAVGAATLKALQGRELTLENIRRVFKAMAVAVSSGVAQNKARPAVLEVLLAHAVHGMDATLQKAVQANRTALQQFMDLGVGLQCEQMKTALVNLEKMEGVFMSMLGRVVQGAAGSLAEPWQHVLQATQSSGTHAGSQASAVVAQLVEQSQAALRTGRAANVRAAQTMMNSYGALVSGVLLGMSEGISRTGAGAASAGRARKK